jgi:hypothetical protein
MIAMLPALAHPSADTNIGALRRGLEARRLDVGFPEWRRAGLPVEAAS